MKKKDIDIFVATLLSELVENGYKPLVSHSTKSNSVYISCLHVPKRIRVSDHGFNYAAYNFTPRHKGKKRGNDECDFFPMTDAGINLLMKEIKNEFPLCNDKDK